MPDWPWCLKRNCDDNHSMKVVASYGEGGRFRAKTRPPPKWWPALIVAIILYFAPPHFTLV